MESELDIFNFIQRPLPIVKSIHIETHRMSYGFRTTQM